LIEPAVVLDASTSTEIVRVKMSGYPDLMWCVIRDEKDDEVAWYVLDAGDLIAEIRSAAPHAQLRDAIKVRRYRADVRAIVDRNSLVPRVRHTVILDGTEVIGVVPGEGCAVIPGIYHDWMPTLPSDVLEPRRIARFVAWPLVTAPSSALPGEELILTIALSRERHESTPPIMVDRLEEETELDLDVDVAAVGLDAPSGWRRTLHIDPAGELPSTSVLLRVRADAPLGRMLIHVAFLHRGIVCGHATCAVIIGTGRSAALPVMVSACSVPGADEAASDLVVMIRKADGNGATGRYVWSMSSTRGAIDSRPFPIDLGDDPRTFARSLMRDVEQTDKTLLDLVLRSIGQRIASYVPAAFWEALHVVAAAIAPERRPPTVLLYSAEEYVPWELALMEKPLSDGLPYLAAQIVLGRWIHSQSGAIPPSPSSSIPWKDLAVLAPDYASSVSDLPKLERAVAEAKHMVEEYGAIEVEATEEGVKRLLYAELARKDGCPAEITILHFAGHGSSNPMLPGSAGLFLLSGKRLSPNVFGASLLGKKFGPLLFLNACEAGMPQRLLADDAGFAGVSLRGGFRGFIGPLWSVDDGAAAEVARRFYEATFRGEASVGDVLREIRRSSPTYDATPLSYVFYGHPRLRLQHGKEA
jgi:CHAT domain-containing protein/uncharacterized protein associated with vWA-MoxR-VMAP ternary system